MREDHLFELTSFEDIKLGDCFVVVDTPKNPTKVWIDTFLGNSVVIVDTQYRNFGMFGIKLVNSNKKSNSQILAYIHYSCLLDLKVVP